MIAVNCDSIKTVKINCVIGLYDIAGLGWLRTREGMFPPKARDQSSRRCQLQLVAGMSQGLFCSCWAARASRAVVLRGRPPRALAAPQAATRLKKHFKQIPPGQFLLPPSWGMYWHTPFFAFRQQKEQTWHSPPERHFSYIFFLPHPISFGGFQAFLEEVPSPGALPVLP